VLTAKKKLAVRKAVPESSFSDTWGKVQEFYELNKKYITWGTVAVIAIVVFGYIYISGKKADENTANSQLGTVIPVFAQGQYQMALDGDPQRQITGLKDIAQKYGSTTSGQLAKIYVAQCYLNMSQWDNAIAAFDECSPSGDFLKSLVGASQAASFEGKKDYAKAADLYESSAKITTDEYLKANRWFNAGRAWCMAGNKDKAFEAFTKAKSGNSTQFEAPVTQYLAQYGLDETEK
jgi:tetratricopeptide (TPR) repeat protein